MALPRPVSFDELGTPLAKVTFVIIDLETTGGAPGQDRITEVGAVKYRGGECLGTFQTLVNPGVPIPPLITVLTGITESMVAPAPTIAAVLPPLRDFLGLSLVPDERPPDAVIVGHNIRFDLAFLNAAFAAHGFGPLPHRHIDTLRLARRLLRDDVPNLRLLTLARHLRAPTVPCHRALEDARATAEVLHALLERSTALGVLGLDDLLALPTLAGHPSAAKLSLTARLPRATGVYFFRDAAGRVLYVGKAANLRARVRSYFGSDDRRRVPQLLRETASVDHRCCAGPLEAAVRELRLIQSHEPRFNRQSKAWRSYVSIELTLRERFPRLSIVREPRQPEGCALGPLSSRRSAQLVQEAIETALPLRRCTRRVGRRAPLLGSPCVPAQLGVAHCPCSGETSEIDYATVVDRSARALTTTPRLLLEPIEARLRGLVGRERFEEAAVTRDRLRALLRALERRRLVGELHAAGYLRLETAHGEVELQHGRLVLDDEPPPAPLAPGPLPREAIDEVLLVARWLREEAGHGRVRVLEVEGTLASSLVPLPSYEPVRRPAVLRSR
ncbi:MAG: DEDD exonuclease domain-containing protein [Acidimicrobiia bacterium]